jgi:triosephosphate isomerase
VNAARTPLVAGNWKMNTTLADAERLVQALLPELAALGGLEVVLCPPFPWLLPVARLLAGSTVGLGAQNVAAQDRGGYTGEVSAQMLAGLCQYVIVGQYERRVYLGETTAAIKRKLQAAQQHGLKPILCVGETSEQLEEGESWAVVAEQLEACLEDVALDRGLVIAYDPPWTTIGMVTPPPPSFANEICGHIRETLDMLYGGGVGDHVRVLYAGNMSPRTAADLAAQPHMDGLLVGASSVNAENFLAFARAFAARSSGASPPA